MEINMKNVTKVGLSALAGALAFTSAHAGDVSVSGSMIASYTKKGGYNTDGNQLGMNKELSVTASGELDNGVSVAYKLSDIVNSNGYGDSELVFTNVPMLGSATLAMTSTGDPMSAIDDVTPIAFEEASAAVGSLKDVNGVDGTYGIRYTLADVAGSGMTLDAMYVPKHGEGDTAGEKGTSGNVNPDGEDGYSVVVKGSVPGIEGLDIGVGYANLGNATTTSASATDVDEGTVYANYAFGSLKVGAQRGVSSTGGTTEVEYDNSYLGVSYAISDNLSISYNEIESDKSSDTVSTLTQDFDSVSLSYTSGGMTIGVLDADCGNCSYNSGRNQSARAIQMTIAF